MKLKHVGIVFLSLSLVLGLNSAIGQGPNSPPVAVKTNTDGPLAIIIGPEQIETGQSAWFKTTGSKGATFVWDITPPEAVKNFTELPIYGGLDAEGKPIIHQWGHFSSNTEDTYYFSLIVVENNRVSIAKHKLVNGPKKDIPTGPGEPDNPPTIPTINVPEPSEELKQAVVDITPLIVGVNAKRDGVELAMFYMDFADIIERDDSIIEKTGDILKANQQSGQLMFQQTGMKGRYINLGFTIDKVFVNVLGLDNVDLTVEKRRAAVDISRAIAWSVLKASK